MRGVAILDRLGGEREPGNGRAVLGLQSLLHQHDAPECESHRDIRIHLHRVQSAGGRIPQHGARGDRPHHEQDSRTREHSRRLLRHRAPVSTKREQPTADARAALLAIYVVLGMLYESYSQPLTIISTLPSAGVGALLALMVTDTEFSLIAFLGILLLIGIVKKNAIMMVDFALDAERTQGLDPRAAIARACSLRFRPIMMTTCARLRALCRWRSPPATVRDAPPLGHLHRWRPGGEPAPDAVHHACFYLYVHRFWSRSKRRTEIPPPALEAPADVLPARVILATALASSPPAPWAPNCRRPEFDAAVSYKEQDGWKPSEPGEAGSSASGGGSSMMRRWMSSTDGSRFQTRMSKRRRPPSRGAGARQPSAGGLLADRLRHCEPPAHRDGWRTTAHHQQCGSPRPTGIWTFGVRCAARPTAAGPPRKQRRRPRRGAIIRAGRVDEIDVPTVPPGLPSHSSKGGPGRPKT